MTEDDDKRGDIIFGQIVTDSIYEWFLLEGNQKMKVVISSLESSFNVPTESVSILIISLSYVQICCRTTAFQNRLVQQFKNVFPMLHSFCVL